MGKNDVVLSYTESGGGADEPKHVRPEGRKRRKTKPKARKRVCTLAKPNRPKGCAKHRREASADCARCKRGAK